MLFCRQEMKKLRKESVSSSKERLTVEWFSQTVSELRAELAELQEASSNASRNMQQRTIVLEEVSELKSEFHRHNLELKALKLRQETTERIVKELRSEAVQSSEDFRRSIRAKVCIFVNYLHFLPLLFVAYIKFDLCV